MGKMVERAQIWRRRGIRNEKDEEDDRFPRISPQIKTGFQTIYSRQE